MPYQICPTTFDDRQTVLDLWQRNLPTAKEGRYGWLYGEGSARDWLLQDDEAVVIGSVGLMRRAFRVRNRSVTAGQAVDMNVDQAHRSLGPALQLQRKALEASDEQGLLFVYGVCDRRSQLVLQRIGYRLLGDVGRWAKPLRSEFFLPSSIRNRKLRRCVGNVVDTALFYTSKERCCRSSRSGRLEIVDRYDERFDALFERVAGSFPLLGERSAEFLNWRFADAPDIRYRAVTLSGEGDELRGYLVYQSQGTVAHVADFLYETPQDLAVLLREFLLIARRRGRHSAVVESLVPQPVADLLRRFGFLPRPSNWPLLVYTPKATQPEWQDEGLFDLDNWYFTRADVDTDV